MNFLNEGHEKRARIIENILKSRAYVNPKEPSVEAFVYVTSAINNSAIMESIEQRFSFENLKNVSLSSKESDLLRFAIQCFNPAYDDITLPNVLAGLDTEYKLVILNAIDLLYK